MTNFLEIPLRFICFKVSAGRKVDVFLKFNFWFDFRKILPKRYNLPSEYKKSVKLTLCCKYCCHKMTVQLCQVQKFSLLSPKCQKKDKIYAIKSDTGPHYG